MEESLAMNFRIMSEGSVNMLCIEEGKGTTILYLKNAHTLAVRKREELSYWSLNKSTPPQSLPPITLLYFFIN